MCEVFFDVSSISHDMKNTVRSRVIAIIKNNRGHDLSDMASYLFIESFPLYIGNKPIKETLLRDGINFYFCLDISVNQIKAFDLTNFLYTTLSPDKDYEVFCCQDCIF